MERDTGFDGSSRKQSQEKKLRPHASIAQDKPRHRRPAPKRYLQEWQEESRGESDASYAHFEEAEDNIGYTAVSIICLICCTFIL